jgi:molybdate transport system permease protein
MDPSTTFPIWFSLRVAACAMLIVAPLGLALAWIQARCRYPGRRLLDGIILLPLILPPSVVGFALVMCFGTNGPVGQWLASTFGVGLVFTPSAAVIAAAIVALPIMVKTAQPALTLVPREMEGMAQSLGLPPLQVFLRVTVPASWPGLVAAFILAFARAMGEFGATLMFAGNIPGRTNTMPLEIYAAYQQGDDARALTYVLILTAISCLVLWLAGHVGRRAEETR